MAFVFGIDEAGYGPRLGPLIVAASGWSVNGDPREFDFWGSLSRVVCRERNGRAEDTRLHVADSKRVYSPSQGLAQLERSVLSILAVGGHRPASLPDLWRRLSVDQGIESGPESYLSEDDLAIPLPCAASPADVGAATLRVADEFEKRGLRLHSLRVDIVGVERFNRLTRLHGSKGSMLTAVSLELVRRCWKPVSAEPVLVLSDRHGGRRYYRGALVEALDGTLVSCMCERAGESHYRVAQSEFRFETGGERHFPVAFASMCAKYIRELTMEAHNRFWRRHVPGLRATKGYPADAGRFRKEIAHTQRRLGILDDVLWRIR